MALLLLVVEPLLVKAPWWTYPDAGFWVVLTLPLMPWAGLAGLMIWCAQQATSRLNVVLYSLLTLAASIIPVVVVTLLLADVFPASGPPRFSLDISLAAGAAALALLPVVLVRTRRARRTCAEAVRAAAATTHRATGS